MATILRRLYGLACGLLVVGSLVVGPAPVSAAGGVVGTGSAASCTEAAFDSVFFAAMSSGGGTITFNCGAAPHTIIFSAQKAVAADVEIRGGGLISLSGGNATSLFQVFSAKTLTLRGLTLTRSYGSFGAIENFGTVDIANSQFVDNTATDAGGALANHGAARLASVVVANNTANQAGGAIFSDAGTTIISASQFTGNRTTATFGEGGALRSTAVLTITTSTFLHNSASRGGAITVADGTTFVDHNTFEGNWGAYGGGIRQTGGTLTIHDVTFKGNGYATNGTKVTTGGGALSWDGGTAALANVTISGNWGSYGGGFDMANGTATLINVTISGNTAVGAGAFDQASGNLTLTNVTIAYNAAPFFAGGIANRGGALTLKNTMLVDNVNPDNQQSTNCYKPITPSGFSLSSDYSCTFETGRNKVNLPLEPLANNGGFTPTHLPQPGSAAIDNGTGAGCPPTDQRMVTRPQGQACDVGAVEIAPDDRLVKVYLPLIQH